MSEEQIALSRRAIACKGWRWMPGMAIEGLMLTSTHGLCGAPHGRVLDMRDDDGMQMVSASEYPYDDDGVPEYRWADLTLIPDLTDPATLGCLLALVREAHGSPMVTFEGQTYASVLCVVCGSGNYYIRRDCGDGEEALYVDGVWSANVRHGVDEVSCATEAEALVTALEAAP